VERYLLNSAFEIGAPGNYLVEAKHGEGHPSVLPMLAELRFRVDGDVGSVSGAELQPWIDQLGSDDLQKRREAARVLASAGSPALEETLLGFAKNPDFQLYAPLALHRLNSPRSLQAMAELLSSAPYIPDAARYLAETGDQKWYPVLRDAAVKNGKIVSEPDYAAELGGVKMLPVLISLERDPGSRLQAVMAMGSTGSREAIPILIELLKHPDPETSWRAYYSLYELTHRNDSLESQDNFHADAQYTKWSEWWNRDGATAPIYKPTHCLGRPTEP
jgi:HEAT repeat protein